jgi:hypothetical protein
VLLLNIIQTAPRDDPTAHAKYGWSEYATRVLEIVSRDGGSFYAPKKHPNPIAAPPLSSSDTKGLVFLAWGPHAIQHIRSAGILNVRFFRYSYASIRPQILVTFQETVHTPFYSGDMRILTCMMIPLFSFCRDMFGAG